MSENSEPKHNETEAESTGQGINLRNFYRVLIEIAEKLQLNDETDKIEESDDTSQDAKP